MNKRSRAFCFTKFKPFLPYNPEIMSYMIFQYEEAPETKKKHQQGYVYFKDAKTISAASKNMDSAHMTIPNGSLEQNIAYCTKKESQIQGKTKWPEAKEYGTRPEQGKRTDINKLVDAIKSGSDDIKILQDDKQIATLCRYPKIYGLIKNILSKQVKRTDCQVHVFYGPPGTGKTYHALRQAKILFGESVWQYTGDLQWFDGYDGQSCIVMDDFELDTSKNSSIKSILQLWDKNICQRPVKGSFLYIIASTFFVTCNDVAWIESDPAIRRRITTMTEFTEVYNPKPQAIPKFKL